MGAVREPNLKLWNSRTLCYVCHRSHQRDVPATIRVFSGIGGGGFSACKEHEAIAITRALEPLSDTRTTDDYTVTATEVLVNEDGGPKPGRVLWRATKRDRVQIPPQPTP